MNNTGNNNTATGNDALVSNTTGSTNIANGNGALARNTIGNYNTADGYVALTSNTTGNYNIALGIGAGGNLATGDLNIDIGNAGVADEGNTIRIGDRLNQTQTFIAGIWGVDEGGSILPVYINYYGQLGTISSSRRFKKEIKPMDKASEAILSLKPVTFHYKNERDPKGIPQFGLVAEDVEKVNPDLVVRDKEGKPYTVRYDQVNAMLLNEFLKEHRKVERLEAALGAVNERLKEQDAKIQKVSAQIEMNRPAPQQVAVNKP